MCSAWTVVSKCLPFYQDHCREQCQPMLQWSAYSVKGDNTGFRLCSWGGKKACKKYFAGFLHFQRLILRIECCFKLNCSTSFLARPFFFVVVCLLFCQFFFISHCQISYLHVLFCGNSVALEDVCWLFFSLSSLLLVLALICHAVLSLSPHSADLC